MHLCNLPSEVLDLILDYALPSHRLAAQRPRDLEWLDYWEGDERQRKPLPSLFFVNKLLSQHALAVFYSKAILEIRPVKPPQFVLNGLERGFSFDLATELDALHAFCPSSSLERIKQVYIFSGQSDVINAEGYEATLRWLIENTSVKDIHLSRLLMIRLRRARVNVDPAYGATILAPALLRTVYVWTKHNRSYWEQMRMREMTKARGEAPPPIQMYVYDQDIDVDPILDPRWDARSSDDEERRSVSRIIANFLDDLGFKDVAYRLAKSAWEAPLVPDLLMDRLYQVCFIVGSA